MAKRMHINGIVYIHIYTYTHAYILVCTPIGRFMWVPREAEEGIH